MITAIIKRDGRAVPFSAQCLNGWGEWSAENLNGHVDWPTVVMRTVASLPETCKSTELHKALIRECLNMDSWSHYRMAGRLYVSTYRKEVYGKDHIPTIKEVHEKLQEVGYMVKLDYSEEDYAQIEKFINHDRDFRYPHFQVDQLRGKYALRNRLGTEEYETPQFIYMRMAMALAEDQPRDRRIHDVKMWYNHFSLNRISPPTPNYVNLGTPLRGYASCCLYVTTDSARSLAVGDHIGYMMTVSSAGIGANLRTRSVGDPVRGGLIKHQGLLPYYASFGKAIRANMQNGRAGAGNMFFECFDPEVMTIAALKNPMSVEDKKNRDMDYAMLNNKFFARKVAKNEDVFLFNIKTAPDLSEAFYSKDPSEFERLYAQYEANPDFKKTYLNARDIAVKQMTESFTTGHAHFAMIDEMNRHTPFRDSIRQSNLCMEIALPTDAYTSMQQLYTAGPTAYTTVRYKDGHSARMTSVQRVELEDGTHASAVELKAGQTFRLVSQTGAVSESHEIEAITEQEREPEVALCSIAALLPTNIENDDVYASASYYALLMIDKCIHMSDYELPHVGWSAKQRLSAGVGIMDLAHYMARKKLDWDTDEGKAEIHRVAERHMWHLISASSRLAEELGPAPWMHRTNWVNGWMPIDTYNKNVDQITPPVYHYDWDALREQVKKSGGLRHSTVATFMPGESSSKAAGATNSIYRVRETTLMKTDNERTTYWAAPDSERLEKYYERNNAWDAGDINTLNSYAIFQKFTDQAISADLFRRIGHGETVDSKEMIESFLYMHKVGIKTRYYQNTRTSQKVDFAPIDAGPDTEVLTRLMEHYGTWISPDKVQFYTELLLSEAPDGSLTADEIVASITERLVATDLQESLENDGEGCASGGCSL